MQATNDAGGGDISLITIQTDDDGMFMMLIINMHIMQISYHNKG